MQHQVNSVIFHYILNSTLDVTTQKRQAEDDEDSPGGTPILDLRGMYVVTFRG